MKIHTVASTKYHNSLVQYFYCSNCECACNLDDAIESEIDDIYLYCTHKCQHDFDADLHAEYARKINSGELC